MIIKHFIYAIGLLCMWFFIAIGVAYSGATMTVAVPISTPLPPNISIVGKQNHFLLVRGENSNFVRDLYKHGASIVLPARQKTCLDLQAIFKLTHEDKVVSAALKRD